MNVIANFLLRALGFGKAVDALDGETSKAYLGGLGLILSGAASTLAGAANLVLEVVPLKGAGAYIAFAQSLSHDPNTALVLAGAAMVSKGIAEIGQRHATAKLANAVAAQAEGPGDPPAQAPASPPAQ